MKEKIQHEIRKSILKHLIQFPAQSAADTRDKITITVDEASEAIIKLIEDEKPKEPKVTVIEWDILKNGTGGETSKSNAPSNEASKFTGNVVFDVKDVKGLSATTSGEAFIYKKERYKVGETVKVGKHCGNYKAQYMRIEGQLFLQDNIAMIKLNLPNSNADSEPDTFQLDDWGIVEKINLDKKN